MATITTNGQSYESNIDPRTGKAFRAGISAIELPSIDANKIGTQTMAKFPPQTFTQPQNYEIPIQEKTPLQLEQEKISLKKQSETSGIEDLMRQIGITQGQEAQFATEAGADVAEQKINQYSKELVSEQNSLKNAIKELENKNKTGMFGGSLEQETNRLKRESESRQADLAILGNAARGDFETALSIAKRKVESALRPVQAKLDAKKFNFENNKDLYTKAELSKLEGFIKADERKLKSEEDRLTKGNEMIINALQFGAPQDVINKTNDIIKKGGSMVQIAQSLGKYNKDIDMEVKKSQIAKNWADAKKTDLNTGVLSETQIKKIDTSPQGKKLVSLSGLYQKSQTYKNLVDTYGFKAAGKEKSLLDSAYADLKIAWKEAANLGALTGPDVQIIEEAIKPSSGAMNYLNYQLSGGKGGVTGAIDKALSSSRKEAIQNYKQLTARDPNYRNSDYVNQLVTPFAKDYDNVDLETAEAGEIIQTEDGLLLESLGGGKFTPL